MKLKASELILATSVFLVAFMMVFLSRYIRLESPFMVQTNEEVLFLHEGGTLQELIPLLHSEGFRFNTEDMLWASDIFKLRGFRPGRYEMKPSYSYEEFLNKLSRGLQDPMRIVINGGMEPERFITRVATQLRFNPDELRLAMKDSTLLEELEVDPKALIGRMVPNTYEIYWTVSPEQFIRRMMQEFDKAVFVPYGDRAAEIGLTIDEVTTLASIIEWEVRHVDEKPRVSGVYWNRLNRRMLLQADPTVNFAIGERRRLFNSDYLFDHPYNTYRVRGLPPGPINNPRITSIQAALYPENHNFLFMVAQPGTGYHTFTTNYTDHLIESSKWSAWIREQQRIRPQREAEALQESQNQGR